MGRLPLLTIFLVASCAGCGKDPETPAVPSAGQTSSDLGQRQEPHAATRISFVSPEGAEKASIEVEVVHTPAKIQRGLMHRQHMPPDRGMLFVFASERVRSFWMKNTLIPLDMMFVKADGTIAGIVEETVPLSLESRSIGVPTQYVIEVNGGFSAEHGVTAGDAVQFENMPEIENPPL